MTGIIKEEYIDAKVKIALRTVSFISDLIAEINIEIKTILKLVLLNNVNLIDEPSDDKSEFLHL